MNSRMNKRLQIVVLVSLVVITMSSFAAADYTYNVNPTRAVCGSDGIVSLKFEPSGNNITVTIANCNNSAFSQSGLVRLHATGIGGVYTAKRHIAGVREVVFDIDPQSNFNFKNAKEYYGEWVADGTFVDHQTGKITIEPVFSTSYGSAQVSISPTGALSAGAKWQIDSGAWQNSGATVNNLSTGYHTIDFSSVSGWTAPVSQDVYVNANQTATASGIYQQQQVTQYGSVQVTISPSGLTGAKWQVDGGAWQNSSATVPNLSVGNHRVSFSPVSGWTAPVFQDVYVNANQTATASGIYQQQQVTEYGSVQVTISPSGAVGAQWQIDGGAWQNSGITVPNVLVGNRTISFKTISGWTTPPNKSVNVSANTKATLTGIYTSAVANDFNKFRVWIDKNNNGNYDSGEGVEGSHVFVNEETTERGVTDKNGFIQLSNIDKSTAKIYAYKEFYSVEHPRNGYDSVNKEWKYFGGELNSPFFASNKDGKMEGKSYRFVMASDIMDEDPGDERGKYYDFPGKKKTLQDNTIQRDSESNILVKLVHPMLEWNLVFAFESPHVDSPDAYSFYTKLKTGIQKFADYMYNFTDGYSVIRNVVLVKGAYEYTEQWKYSDVQIENLLLMQAAAKPFGITKSDANPIYMGKPDSTNWYPTLGHESGHYLLGFNDEYQNANGQGGTKGAWDYRDSHDGYDKYGKPSPTEPNEFPRNYGIMDHQSDEIHELSDATDYFYNQPPYNDPNGIYKEKVTAQYYRTSRSYKDGQYHEKGNFYVDVQPSDNVGMSTWELFKIHFQREIKDHMNGQGFSDAFFANLIIPPHTTGSYPPPKDISGQKRPYPKLMDKSQIHHEKVNIIDWGVSEDIFGAKVKVVDGDNKPLKEAEIYLFSGEEPLTADGTADTQKMQFIGKTNAQGLLSCDSFNAKSIRTPNQQTLLASHKIGKGKIVIVEEISSTSSYTITIGNNSPSASRSKGKRDSQDGIIISAKPDSASLKGIVVTASGKKLNTVPMVRLFQPNGYSSDISMLVSGDNYSGSAEYFYDSGLVMFSGTNNLTPVESINPYEVFSTDSGHVSGYYAPHGELEMTYSSDSFSGSGRFVILNSILAAPPNGNLIQVGNVWSLGFEDSIGTVHNVGFNIMFSDDQLKGLDASQLNLYGWDEGSKTWQLIPGGTNDLKVFSIGMDSLAYVSYALFAPLSDDVSPPSAVTNLQAKTGSSGWSVELQWIAPSDDRGVYVYDVRYNTVPITEENWYSSFEAGRVPKPAEAGTTQSFIIEMPDPNTDYYFAIRSSDAAGNKSVMTTLNSPTKSRTPYQTVNAGTFTVDSTGIVKIDWLYDGGKYQGEFGIFNLAGMENLTPGSPEFIAEAVKRVMSNTEQGYVVFSDLQEGARFSGLLGGEVKDWNTGDYKGVKSFTMKPGSQFATVLVPNSTFSSLAQDPATTDTNRRPLFSLVSSNPAYGMYSGQMADVNGMGKAYSYEDKDAATSDKDFNDLIVQITGAAGNLPSIDDLKSGKSARQKRDGYGDWRDSAFGQMILAHIEAPAPTEDTVSMIVTLNAPATLLVYDPAGKVIGKAGGTIAGANFELKADGTQTVTLPDPAGNYRLSIQGAATAHGTLTVKTYQGSAEISSEQIALDIAPHQILTATISADGHPPVVGSLNAAAGYDFNGDGITDDADVQMLVKHWNSCRGHQKYDAFFDVNDDGCITVADIMMVLNAKTVK